MECVDSAMMELCTCIADKEMTCIVHPTERALKERIADQQQTIDQLQQRVEALEKLLDPETLARKIGDWDFTHNSDYFCFKFGGDGDNGEMLIEALAALLKETAQ